MWKDLGLWKTDIESYKSSVLCKKKKKYPIPRLSAQSYLILLHQCSHASKGIVLEASSSVCSLISSHIHFHKIDCQLFCWNNSKWIQGSGLRPGRGDRILAELLPITTPFPPSIQPHSHSSHHLVLPFHCPILPPRCPPPHPTLLAPGHLCGLLLCHMPFPLVTQLCMIGGMICCKHVCLHTCMQAWYVVSCNAGKKTVLILEHKFWWCIMPIKVLMTVIGSGPLCYKNL